jgi:hypothetical protein
MTERGKRWLSFLGVLLHRRPLLGHEPKVVAQVVDGVEEQLPQHHKSAIAGGRFRSLSVRFIRDFTYSLQTPPSERLIWGISAEDSTRPLALITAAVSVVTRTAPFLRRR